DPGAAEGVQRIVSEAAIADIAADAAFAIARGETGVAHGRGFDAAHASTEGVQLADRSGNDLLEIHFDVGEEVLGEIAAVEADGLVWIITIIVVPIEQRAGRSGGEPQGMHADNADDIGFARAR